MATLPFPAAQSKSKFPSRFTHFNYRATLSKLFFTTPFLNHSRRRNLSVKNIASDQRQDLQDPVTRGGCVYMHFSSLIRSSVVEYGPVSNYDFSACRFSGYICSRFRLYRLQNQVPCRIHTIFLSRTLWAPQGVYGYCRECPGFAYNKLEYYIWVLCEDECEAGLLSVYGVSTGKLWISGGYNWALNIILVLLYILLIVLQGRALLNAIGNLELSGAYAEDLRKLGHNLEDVARQVKWIYDSFIQLLSLMPFIALV